jgi:alpha-1,3-mannosyltransferase
MRIVHLTNNFFPVTGGIETYVYELAKRSVKSGNEVFVIASDRDPVSRRRMKKSETLDGIRIIRVPFKKIFLYNYSFAALKEALSLKPDIIHIHGLGGFTDLVSLMKIGGSKIVVSTHGGIFHTKNARFLKEIYFNTSVRLSLWMADKVIAHSEHDRQLFSKICDIKKIVLSHYGVDWRKFSSIKRATDGRTLIYVGRLGKNKRLDRLLDAISIVKERFGDVRLLLVGEDWGEKANLVKQSGALNIGRNIVFAGAVPHKEIAKYLKKSDIFLLSSEYEGFGIAVLEALSSGIPAIVNDIGPMHEMIRQGVNGYMTDFANSRETAGVISRALKRRWDFKLIKDSVKLFDWDEISKEIEKIYSGV